MAKETEDFDLGFTPEQFAGVQADQGAGFRRLAFGDYTLEITGGEIVPSKNAKTPHNMFKPTFTVVKAHDEKNKGEVGGTCDGLYGTANSPPFMQSRMKALCEACKVVPGKGGLKLSQLIGKKFDATVIWELSDSNKLDDFGRKKFWVNARVKGERPVGQERPKTLNPVSDSAKAVKYAEGLEATDAPTGDIAPWDASASTPAPTAASETASSSFIPESEVEPTGHQYRALYKLGGEDSAAAKEALIDAGIDPEGPVDTAHLDDDLKASWIAKFGNGEKKGGLAALKKPAPRAGARA